MPTIIIRGKSNIGKTRSEQELNLRKGGWGGTMTDAELDKCKYLEKIVAQNFGSKKNFFRKHHLDLIKDK